MRYASEVYLFFPGGFGTLDELSESLTLVQTNKISSDVKLVLVGEDFWGPLQQFVVEKLIPEGKVSEGDQNLYTITDDEDAIIEIIKNAPKREKN